MAIIHTLALDAALGTAGDVSNRLCLPNCQEPANYSALQKGTARNTLAHLLHPLRAMHSVLVGFHPFRQKLPLLWQEDPAKAQHLSQAVLL